MSDVMTRDVSVIVNTFRPTQDLHQTLDSVFGQSLKPAQVLLIDDGSPATYDPFFDQLLQRYRDTWLVLIRSPSNQGVASARNLGLANAEGAAICFLDQDDLWPEHKLEQQLKNLCDDPALDGIAGTQVFLKDATITEKPKWMGAREFDKPYPGYILGALMIRKTALDRVGLFDPNLHHGTDDVDWFFRAKLAGLNIRFDPRPALLKRIHANNESRYAKQHNQELLKVVRRHIPKGE